MGGKLTSALSQETRNLLRDNQSFFEEITKQGETTGKRLKGKDQDAKTEVEVRADGNVAVTFLIPIDDDKPEGAADGRIELRDTFVFDPSLKKLNSYKRDFKYNGRGENKEEWKKWLAAYQTAALPDDQKLQAFALMVARTFSRPFSAKHIEIFSKNKPTQFQTLIDATQENKMALRVRDPRSHYAVFHRGLTTEVVFSYVVEDTEGKLGGHLLVQDKFSFNGNSGEIVGYDRDVKIGDNGGEEKEWLKRIEKIRAAEKPSLDNAKAFIKNFMPDLLTAIPEPAAPMKAEAEPANYADYSDALFKKTMNTMVRSEKAIPLADLEPQFFNGLVKAKDYFAPLQASLGSDYTLNLKDPPVEVSTQVEGEKTYVFMKYSFQTPGEKGTLDYTERFTFEKGFPTKVDRRASALGAEAGGTVARVAKRITDDIDAGKYPGLKDEAKKEYDSRTVSLLEGTIPYAAPHLTYFGMPKVLEKPELTYDQRIVFGVLDSAQSTLTPLLNQSGVDPMFRARVTRMLTGMVYGDLNTASAAMMELEETESKALQAATTPEAKFRHEDNLRLTNVVFALSSGDLEKAQALIKTFHSPALKRAFEKPLAPAFARKHSLEGLAVISKIAEDQIALRVRDSKAWSYKGPKIDAELEKKVVQGLFDKAFLQTTQSKKSDALEVLRELLAIGKDKKPEQYDEAEKKLALTGDERALAERLIADPLMMKVAAIAQDDMKDIQAQSYLTLARDELFDKGMVGSARWIAQTVALDKLPKGRSAESLDILKTMAAEKIDNAYPALKKDPGKVELPPEMAALEPLLTKAAEKSIADPKKSVFTVLNEMTDLQGDEAKLRDRLLNSPSMKKLNDAAKLPTVAERVKVYRSIFDPVLKSDPNNPMIGKVKAVVDEQIGAVEKMSQDDAPGPEGVLLTQLVIQVDLAADEDQKMKGVKVAAEAHDKDAKAAMSLLEKASLAAIAMPNATAFDVLRSLKDEDLNADEKKVRGQLLEDKTLEKYTGIVAEASMEKRVESYKTAVTGKELDKAGYPQAQVWLATMLQSGKLPDLNGYFAPVPDGAPKPAGQERAEKLDRDVRKFLALTEGKGDFGSKFEVGMKHFTKEVSKPTTLAAMTVAPFVGAGCELVGLWKLRSWGSFGRVVAAGIGVTGEAAAFTYTSKTLDSYFYTSEGQWDHHVKDFKSNVLLFGAMRTAHYGSAAFTERFLATGRLGKWGGGYVAGEEASGLVKTPAGKIEAVGKAAGPGAPQLTVAGRRMGTLLDHTGAVGAMYGAGKLNHKLGYSQHDASFSDTLLMYMQAMAGFKLADAATFGRLGVGMAGAKMRIQNMQKGGAPVPAEPKPIPEGMLRLFDSKVNDVTLTKVDGGETLGLLLPRPDTKASVDAFMLGEEGSGLRLSRDKDGKLTLHNEQKVDDKPEAKPEEKKADKPADDGAKDKPEDKQDDGESKADEKPETKPEPAKEEKPEDKKDDTDPKTDDKKDDGKEGPPAKLPALVFLNGKPVLLGDSAKLSPGDVISVDGKEFKVDAPSELNRAMARAPREQQLSLARKIAKAKDPGALFRMLKDSPYQGAVEILMAVGEVFSGKQPLANLPTEMGIQAKVKELIETQVADMKKSGLEVKNNTEVKDGLIDPRLSDLEVEFQTLKAMESLKLRISMARDLPELIEVLGEAPFKRVGGITSDQVFDLLGHEQLKAVLESAKKNEATLREKIEIGEKRLKLEEGKKKKDVPVIEELKEKLEDWKESAEQSKTLQGVLEKALEASKPAPDADPATTDLAAIVEQLPLDLGIRQKARDAVEQSKGEFAGSLSKKETQTVLDLFKRYVDVQAKDDFNAAQRGLRREIDSASPLARLMLRRAKPEELEILLKVYFGKSEARDLPAAQAYQVATMLGQSRIKTELGLLQPLDGSGDTLQLVRGDLDALTKAVDGKALVLRSHSAEQDGGNLVFTKGELLALAEQAKQTFAGKDKIPASGDPYRGTPKQPYQGQLSDTQVFFDPETRTVQTWTVHQNGLSKIRIALDEKGEIESYEIKYALRPEAGGNSGLLTPQKFSELTGADGKAVKVKETKVDYDALTKEYPFDIAATTRAERVFDGIARVTGKIPSLPKLPKFGKDKPADAAKPADAKPKSDPKDPPADKPDGSGPDQGGKAPAKPKKKGKRAKAAAAAGKPTGASEAKPEAKADDKGEAKTDAKAEAKPGAATATPDKGLLAFLGGKLNPVSLVRSLIGLFSRGGNTAAPKPKAKTKVESAGGKPAAKVEDPTVVKPAALPPQAEGNRPTLPEGLQFPPAKLAMGEIGGFDSLEIDMKANAVMGEAYGKTHEGVGRDANQDGIAALYTPEGDLVIIDADGMGGHAKGEVATRIFLENAVTELSSGKNIQDASQLANQKVMADLYNPSLGDKQPGAGVVFLKVNRPATAGAPSTMEASWGSDVALTLYREAPNGDAHWIYSTLPDNIGRQIVDMGQMYGPKGEGRDLAINSNPRANMVNNTVGKPDFQLHFTEEGEVFDAEAGFKPATGLKQIALEEGDVVIGGSDGLWKNIPNRNLAYEWTKDAKTAQEKVAILDAKIRERMKVVDEADRKFGNHELSDSERMPFQMDGKDLFIDNAGNVYDQAKDGTLVDHYEADNVSIFVYVHKFGGGETAKVEPKRPAGDSPTGDPKTPSDTSLSDPDKTTMWVRPESLKDTVVVEDPKNAARDPDEEVTVVRPMPKDTGNPQ